MEQVLANTSNLDGFEGDLYLKQEIQRLVTLDNIQVIFETGTYLGNTTKQFATMVNEVVTVEINQTYFDQAQKSFEGVHHIKNYLGNSPDVMDALLPQYRNHNMLFYLDAHWGDVCPLKSELKCIAAHGIMPVIVIHDFLVPGKDFGYDSYLGQPFTYDWFKPELDAIYGTDQYQYFYNKKAMAAYRGVLFCRRKTFFSKFMFKIKNLIRVSE